MKNFRADLHVHTVLSPCADVEMIPPLIVEEALANHIDIIAITDHNASANVPAVQKAAEKTSLTVLSGMEVQSCEDVHLLCLFENFEVLKTWQTAVTESLPKIENRADFFGEQYVVNEYGEYISTETQMLLSSCQFSIDEIFEQVHALGGLTIPAHVDRKIYGLFPTLGLIAPQWHALAFEISRLITPQEAVSKFPALANQSLIQGGDAHRLNEFLGTTIFTLEEPTFLEVSKAFHREGGREVYIE